MDRDLIAIVGIGCRFPGGVRSPDDLWDLLVRGVDAVGEVPPSRWDAGRWTAEEPTPGRSVTRFGAFLDAVDTFDAGLFGISPREARMMDPQQRLLLQVAWEALERSGVAPDRAPERTGVYVGMGLSDYARRTFLTSDPERLDPWSGTGAFSSVAAGRIAYALGLRGPALAVHTACSSSLVAVHLAIQALRARQIDAALAGGANLLLSPEPSVYFSQLQALSADGRCRTFDADASGYGRGEGVGLVALMRLDDARASGHPVLAVIRGSAVNQDGRSNGLTAPSGRAQQEVLRAALADAGLNPVDVGYVEAHGTGTPLGDPIEMEALRAVYDADGPPLQVGSVKTNLGHLEAAAGVAGLVKAVLALQHGLVPQHLHLRRLNPRIRLDGSRLRIPIEAAPFEGPPRAGVSAFGMSGTNAHLLVEAAPEAPTHGDVPGPHLLVLSARDERSLDALQDRWQAALPALPLADAAHTAAVGRAELRHRLAVVASDGAAAAAALPSAIARPRGRRPSVVFAYTGQGAQRLGMARELLALPAFREAFDLVDEKLAARRGRSLHDVLDHDDLHHTRWTQPALFAYGWALTALWRSWGVEPDAVVGHSVGEIAAAAVAGVLSLDDAVALVDARARHLGELPAGGAMAAVRAGADTVGPHLVDGVSIAAVNAADETVLSGDEGPLAEVLAALETHGVEHRRLTVSHAFHSHRMDPALDPFEAEVGALTFREPELPWATGEGRLAGREVTNAGWWRRQVRDPVRFADAVGALVDDGLDTFLEVGPGPILSGLGPRIADSRWIPSARADRERATLLEAAGALWTEGLPVRLDRVVPGRRIAAPTYAFAEERYWIEPVAGPDRSAIAWATRWVPIDPTAPTSAAPSERPAPTALLGDPDLAARLGLPGTLDDPAGAHVVLVAGDDAPATLLRASDLLHTLGDGTLRVLTRRAVSVDGEAPVPAGAALWGFGAVAALEHPDRWGGLVDVQDLAAVDPDLLRAALAHPDDRLAVRDGRLLAERLAPAAPLPAPAALPDGPWVITGGSGALAAAVARHLVGRGVTHLVLLSRSGRRPAGLDDLASRARIEVQAADVSDADALASALPADPAGVVHLAGISHPAPSDALEPDALRHVWAGKAAGAAALDHAIGDATLVVFGSIAGTWGSAGLAAYAAANRYAEAVAEARRTRGLPALAVSYGPWAAGGMVSADELASFARLGVRPLHAHAALAQLDALLAGGPARLAVADVDWDRLRPVLEARRPRPLVADLGRPLPDPAVGDLGVSVREPSTHADRHEVARAVAGQVAAVLGHPPDLPLDPERGFFDLGLDSVMAVELAARLRQQLGVAVTPTAAFDHPTIAQLTAHLLAALGLGDAAVDDTVSRAATDEPIAVVGMACRFPGADDPDAFWKLLVGGIDAVGDVPPERWDAAEWSAPDAPERIATDQGGFLGGIERFDAAFFGMGPDEAAALDPQQRLLLEVGWEALERAGAAPRSLRDSATGVFVGIGRSEYWSRLAPSSGPAADAWAWSGTGNESSFAAGRLAALLGLRGPALGVNTACSSSLVALHLAVGALRSGECDRALAGGVNVILDPEGSAWLTRIGALSPTGRCHTFDAAADGYVRSEGCGVVVLRRLSDALADGDDVLAVIRGSAIGHDGATGGLTVPSGPSQQGVIRRALADAGVSPDDVSFVECHGTGTALGDPIEVGALKSIHQRRERPLILGAVKTQVGHLEAAAGMAGLLKVVLALRHGTIPGNLHLQRPNPALPLDFPVTLPTEGTPWPEGERVAGLSSFGISGTNAHVILAEPPKRAPRESRAHADVPPHLLLVSGHAPAARDALRAGLVSRVDRLDDLAATLVHGRSAERHRLALVVRDEADARRQLLDPDAGQQGVADRARPPRVAFLFTGQGAQQPGAGLALRERDPVFREALDRCAELLRPRFDLLEVLADGERLGNTRYTQPALFALGWALAARWQRWGVVPHAVVGHSVGQYVAAAVAGVLELEGALELVAERGRLMAELPPGVMAAVRAPEAVVAEMLLPGADLAAVNGPADTVISGEEEAVGRVLRRLEAAGHEARRLAVSHAFHSAMMEPVLAPFARLVEGVDHRSPRLPLVSDLDGAPLHAVDGRYWVAHLRDTIRFADAVRQLGALGVDTFVELGPRPVLAPLAGRILDEVTLVPSLRPGADEGATLLEGLGALWVRGVPLDPAALYPRRPPVPIPTTAWQRKRHWIESPHARPTAAPASLHRVAWTPSPAAPLAWEGPVAILGEDDALRDALDARGIPLVDDPADAAVVVAAPRRAGEVPDATRSALQLTRRWLRELLALPRRPRLLLLTRHGISVDGEDVDPAAAAVHGLVGVLALEHPELRCGVVDVDDGAPDTWLDALGHPADRVTVRGGVVRAPRLEAWEPTASGRVPRQGAVLVTGGLGALGRRVARWLLRQGAEQVVLVGRRAPSPDIEAELADLDRVIVRQADVADDEALGQLLDGLDRPVVGLVHCAGTPQAAWVHELDPDDLDRTLAPKVQGAWNLHRRLGDVPLFVLFGSATAWFGLPGQAAYAAANAFLDGLAAHRRAAGLAAVSVAWGPWKAGMADRRDWAAEGVEPLADDAALAALGDALRGAPPSVLALRADWGTFRRRYPGRVPALLGAAPATDESAAEAEPAFLLTLRDAAPARRRALLADRIRGEAGRLLSRDDLRDDHAFFDAGMDSLGAVDLARRLGRALGRVLPATVAFDHPTVERLVAHLLAELDLGVRAAAAAVVADASHEPIAIVGMAFRFPGASDPDALWEVLAGQRVVVGEVPPDRWDADAWYEPEPGRTGRAYTRQGAFLDEIDRFDPDLFGISPREAASLDPQQRILLETSWRALEDAGHASDEALRSRRTGVFVGIADRGYLRRFQAPGGLLYPDAWAGTGTEPSFAAGRISHALGLTGPAVALDTTCSSSLVAVHLACRSLREGECDEAVAGGVALQLDPEDTAYLCAMNALSPTGRCHTFGADADGYVRGEGCGVFVLARLSDAVARGDRILGVIRGSAVNHDGHASGLTVPNGTAQQAVLRAALQDAGLSPADVDYLEAHGTGTPLGDPIEVGAARQVYDGPLVLGAVKANLGHLELAAGAASLAKALLALKHEAIPPQPELGALNPELPLEGVEIPTSLRPWPRGERPRRVAISGFGLSGTNAHLVVEEPPVRTATAPSETPERPVHLLALSVHEPGLLEPLARSLREAVAPLPDLAFTVHTTRRAHPWRAAVVAEGRAEALEQAASRKPVLAPGRPPRVAFLFTGQGAQYARMALDLHRDHPVFRATLDRCAALLAPHLDVPLLEVLASEELVGRTRYTQPAIFAVSVSIAELWRSWGVEPELVLGHSVGELAAACLAGVFSLEDGLALIAARGELMGALPEGGAMAAILAPEPDVRGLLVPGAEIAGVNAPDETVIAGGAEAVDAVVAAAAEAGVEARPLTVSHAFHSARLDPMLAAWERTVAGVRLSRPRLPLISALTGARVDEAVTSAAWWRRHAREPVRFADALRAARAEGVDLFVEVGPHPVLCGMGQRTVEDPAVAWLPSMRRGADALPELLRSLGRYWERGGEVDWTAFDAPWPRQRTALPPSPLDRRRFWLEGDRHRTSFTYDVTWTARALPTDRIPPSVTLLVPDDPEVARFAEGLAEALRARQVRTGGGPVIDLRPLAGERPEAVLDTARTLSVGHWLVTRGAVSVAGEAPDLDVAPLWGLSRVLYAERPELRGGHVDLDVLDPERLADAIASGEDAVAVRDGRLHVPILEPVHLPHRQPSLHGAWLVTGGLGALGRRVATWLADRGAARLILTGRRHPDGERAEAVERLRARGIEVRVEAVDVSDEDAMSALLEGERLVGIVHAAGVTAPQALDEVDHEVFRDTLRPKVEGARILDRLSRAHPIEHFVLYGSIAGVWGSRDLAAYATANAHLDALAQARRAAGLPAVALDWGPWSDGGMIDDERASLLARMGQRLLPPERALRILGDALCADRARIVVASVDWSRFLTLYDAAGPSTLMERVRGTAPPPAAARRATPPPAPILEQLPAAHRADAVRDRVMEQARAVLRLEADRPLRVDQPLMELGFDSLMATELKNALLAEGLDVPLGRLLGGPSVEEIAVMVEARMLPVEPPTAAPHGVEPPAESDDGDDIPSWLVWTHLAAAVAGAAVFAGVWQLVQRLVFPEMP